MYTLECIRSIRSLIDVTPQPQPSTPSNPISTSAPIQMPPVSVPAAQGKVQLWLISWFGASYDTTIPGIIGSIGLLLMGLVPFTTGRTQQILGILGTILGGGGLQQASQRSKSTKVTGAEPR